MNASARLGLVLEESSSDENDETFIPINKIKQEAETDDSVAANLLQDDDKQSYSRKLYDDCKIKEEICNELEKEVHQQCDGSNENNEFIPINKIKQETDTNDSDVAENLLQYDMEQSYSDKLYEDCTIKEDHVNQLEAIVLLQRCDDLIQIYKTNQKESPTEKNTARQIDSMQNKTTEQLEPQNKPNSKIRCYYNKNKNLGKEKQDILDKYSQTQKIVRKTRNNVEMHDNNKNEEQNDQTEKSNQSCKNDAMVIEYITNGMSDETQNITKISEDMTKNACQTHIMTDTDYILDKYSQTQEKVGKTWNNEEIHDNNKIEEQNDQTEELNQSCKNDAMIIEYITNGMSDETQIYTKISVSKTDTIKKIIVSKDIIFEARKYGNIWKYTTIGVNNPEIPSNSITQKKGNQTKIKVPSNCSICGQKIKSLGFLLRHMNMQHGDYEDENTCKKCFRRFSNQYSYQRHNTHCHLEASINFLKANSRSVQNNTNHTQKVETPTINNKTINPPLVSKSNLISCICRRQTKAIRKYVCRKHGEYSTVICDCCNISFRNKYFLEKHLRGESFKYVCDYCKKRFKTKDVLKTHIAAVHLCIPLFQCYICSKYCSTYAGLYQHLVTHSARTYKCRYCHKLYASTAGRYYHEKRCSMNMNL